MLNFYKKCKGNRDEITNNSFKDYLATFSESDFNVLVKNAKRTSNIFDVEFKSILFLSYKTVKNEIPEMLKNTDFENLIKKLLEEKGKIVSLSDINNYDFSKILAFILWIKDEIEAVYRLEAEYLSSPPDNDMVNAGIRNLDVLGDTLLIDCLVRQWCGRYSHEEVRQMPYHFIFDTQLGNKKQAEFNKNYSEIINKKQKK